MLFRRFDGWPPGSKPAALADRLVLGGGGGIPSDAEALIESTLLPLPPEAPSLMLPPLFDASRLCCLTPAAPPLPPPPELRPACEVCGLVTS